MPSRAGDRSDRGATGVPDRDWEELAERWDRTIDLVAGRLRQMVELLECGRVEPAALGRHIERMAAYRIVLLDLDECRQLAWSGVRKLTGKERGRGS